MVRLLRFARNDALFVIASKAECEAKRSYNNVIKKIKKELILSVPFMKKETFS